MMKVNGGVRGVLGWGLLTFALFAANVAHAELRLGPLFRDGAVLQRGKPVPVWGWADSGQRVKVTFREAALETTAGPDGRWQVLLPAMPACAQPADLTVSAKETATVCGVLVGEVWLCSGQSNMEWHLRDATNAEQEIAGAAFPLIREFRVPHVIAETPQREVGGTWVEASPKTAGSFSAVAYFFARDLHRALNVPVGLINTSWGGKMIEVFLSAEALASDPAFAAVEKRWQEEQARLPAQQAAYEKKTAVGAKGMDPRAVVAQHRPSCLFNGTISPVIPYGLRGALWYQGEHNISRAGEYRAQLSALIADWRAKFGQGDFPFYFAQLSSFDAPLDKSREGYALLREAQAQTLAVTNTGMAVTIDIGTPSNVHPRNKQDVGARLARLAKALTYDLGGEWSGPVLTGAVREGHALRLSFAHAAGGLALRPTPKPAFEVAGADGVFHPASARAEGDALVVQSDAVSEPAAVRYAWGNAPDAALFNAEGLPASPFRKRIEREGRMATRQSSAFLGSKDTPVLVAGQECPASQTGTRVSPLLVSQTGTRVSPLLVSQTGTRVSPLPVKTPHSAQDSKSLLRSVLQPFVDDRVLAGAVVLVADKERVLDLEAVGYADVAAKRPMVTNALFWIASMSKPITAAALMMLADEGKVCVDDPVEKYLPEFKGLLVSEKNDKGVAPRKPKHVITVKNLLTHTSGMSFRSEVEKPTLDIGLLAERVRSYAAMPLEFEPDTKYQYSNAGINTAGRIVEVVSGMSYEAFLEARLFQPLGMKDTTFWPDAGQLARLAKAYRGTSDKADIEETPVDQLRYPLSDRTRGPIPAGGLFSTAADVARFSQMLLNNGELAGRRYLTEAAVREMTRKQTGAEVDKDYGFGLQTTGTKFGHLGKYGTNFSIDTQRGFITVFMVQNAGWRNAEGGKIHPAFYKAATDAYRKSK